MKEKIIKSYYFIPFCYLLFFVTAFLVSFLLTFPVESIRQRTISEIETRPPFKADIEKISLSPIFSLNIRNMKIYKAEKELLNIDELRISPFLFSLFSGSFNLPFNARLLGGEITGALLYSKRTKQIEKAEAKINGVNIEKITPIFPSGLSNKRASIQGFLDGNFSIVLGPEPKGEFSFDMSNLWIKNVRVKSFLFPEFSDMKSSFKGKIENEMTTIEELKLEGDGFDLAIVGTMPLLWNIKMGGVIDLGLKLQLTGPKFAVLQRVLASYLALQRNGILGGKISGTIHNPRLVKEASNSDTL